MSRQGSTPKSALSSLNRGTAYMGLARYVGVRTATGWALKLLKGRLKTLRFQGVLDFRALSRGCGALHVVTLCRQNRNYKVASLPGSCSIFVNFSFCGDTETFLL